jgi:hypothetical protein
MQPVAQFRRPLRSREARRQVEHEQVHRAAGEQRRRDGQALIEIRRRHDDEPLEANATRNRLDRVECLPEVEPRDDRARRLRLRHGSQRNGGFAARARPPQRDAGGSRQAARSQDRVECREPCRDDVAGRERRRKRPLLDAFRGEWRGRERSDDAPHVRVSGHPRRRPWSCRSPARLEGRECGRHVRRERRHGTVIVEQVFCFVNGRARRDEADARLSAVPWGCSSVGRAPRSHRGGQGFESPHLHQNLRPMSGYRLAVQVG